MVNGNYLERELKKDFYNYTLNELLDTNYISDEWFKSIFERLSEFHGLRHRSIANELEQTIKQNV